MLAYLLFLYASGVIALTIGFCHWVKPHVQARPNRTPVRDFGWFFAAWWFIMLWPITFMLPVLWRKR